MSHHHLQWTTAMVCAATLAFTACNRKPSAPELQTTTGVQPRAERVTLTGCLKRGVIAEDTFVVLVSQKEVGTEAATYELTVQPDVKLADHIGQQVEVSGTLRSEQAFASSAGAVTEKPAKGTSGTPVVETKTDVNLKRIDVSGLRPTGSACQE